MSHRRVISISLEIVEEEGNGRGYRCSGTVQIRAGKRVLRSLRFRPGRIEYAATAFLIRALHFVSDYLKPR